MQIQLNIISKYGLCNGTLKCKLLLKEEASSLSVSWNGLISPGIKR